MNAADYNIYTLGPIDSGWEFLPATGTDEEPLRSILELAKKAPFNFSGTFRRQGHPRRSFVPDGVSDFVGIYVWKDEKSGATFVASPVKLPWLEKRG